MLRIENKNGNLSYHISEGNERQGQRSEQKKCGRLQTFLRRVALTSVGGKTR